MWWIYTFEIKIIVKQWIIIKNICMYPKHGIERQLMYTIKIFEWIVDDNIIFTTVWLNVTLKVNISAHVSI